MTKLKKGDTVYVYSGDTRHKSFNGKILSAGSKYIKVKELPGITFEPNSLCSDYLNYRIYISEAEYLNERYLEEEYNKVIDKLEKSYGKLTLLDLAAIEKILDNIK